MFSYLRLFLIWVWFAFVTCHFYFIMSVVYLTQSIVILAHSSTLSDRSNCFHQCLCCQLRNSSPLHYVYQDSLRQQLNPLAVSASPAPPYFMCPAQPHACNMHTIPQLVLLLWHITFGCSNVLLLLSVSDACMCWYLKHWFLFCSPLL